MQRFSQFASAVLLALVIPVLPASATQLPASPTPQTLKHDSVFGADPNAASITMTFVNNASGSQQGIDVAAFYQPTLPSNGGQLIYTFTLPAGLVFSGNFTTVEQSLILGAPTNVVYELIARDGVSDPNAVYTFGGFSDGQVHTDYTPATFNVDGTATLNILYGVNNSNQNAEILRETTSLATPFAFTYSTRAVPEPTALSLLALGGLTLLARRRRL